MQIKDMFAKPIDREIQGVVMVGQGESTDPAQELEEYVVTRELQKHFADFFEAYKKGIVGNTVEIGVWISGFFGSGKSHFLKILSYLLDNKFEINGKRAIDFFIEDNKIADAMVLADMKLASETPTDVILFDIDAKSDSNSKQNKDAIVNVFLKVFNEMQGFCGSLPHLADLESQLTDVGKYDAFKEAFEDEYGSDWDSSRHKFDFIQDDVVEALVKIDFMSEAAARNWCEKASEPYRISIEDFAKRVKDYIEKKGNNHHVVFMVDEVGQYIGDDSSLMLNLQTVRHELSQACYGKAWVVVTSQQDVDSIMKVKGNDFSKIQGRFATRLALSSANVDEVIKKRILEKNDTGAQTLRLLYEQKATIIKNLTWSDVATGKFSARWVTDGYIYADAGPMFFSDDNSLLKLAYMNTPVFQLFGDLICQGLHYSTGQIPQIPYFEEYDEDKKASVERIAGECIGISEEEWNKYESSWEYNRHPLSGGETMGRLIADKYKEWEAECENRFNQLKANEEELNRIFIDIYGLQDELTPEVEDKDVTVRKADLQRDIKSLISYAVGCMFGRYSLDVEGLAYAGGDWDESKYSTFIPDKDNIIPITDEEYFEDDILGLFCGWLKKVYGVDTLEQNLDFIANALGNKGDTSRDIIRSYFVNDFFKDHCQTYSVTGSGKRPIYWLFDSGKQNGFKALIYLHRYNADTIGNLRVDYLHRMQRVYESEIGRMQDMMDHSRQTCI